jgi:hypothetical protein
MVVGVISVGVMTVGVLSVGVTNWTRISANVACFIFKSLKRIQIKKLLKSYENFEFF